MRSARLIAAALIAASVLTACSGENITAPSRRISAPSAAKAPVTAPATGATLQTIDPTACRGGYIPTWGVTSCQ